MNFKYKIEIAYDGTNYQGWQIQPNGLSIQQILQKNISIICRYPVTVIGSGRTDAGVHAKGQVAHFKVPELLDERKLLYSLNGLLPLDIRVRHVSRVPEDFHAQYSAIGKEYHYHIFIKQVLDPFKRLYCWHLPYGFHLSLLEQALPFFIGTHDFTSFANEATRGTAAKDPIRTIQRIDLVEEEGGFCLEFVGDGFLYKMVRNIVGTLIEVATMRKELKEIPDLFHARDRRLAGKAAPAKGLFLIKVIYPDF